MTALHSLSLTSASCLPGLGRSRQFFEAAVNLYPQLREQRSEAQFKTAAGSSISADSNCAKRRMNLRFQLRGLPFCCGRPGTVSSESGESGSAYLHPAEQSQAQAR